MHRIAGGVSNALARIILRRRLGRAWESRGPECATRRGSRYTRGAQRCSREAKTDDDCVRTNCPGRLLAGRRSLVRRPSAGRRRTAGDAVDRAGARRSSASPDLSGRCSSPDGDAHGGAGAQQGRPAPAGGPGHRRPDQGSRSSPASTTPTSSEAHWVNNKRLVFTICARERSGASTSAAPACTPWIATASDMRTLIRAGRDANPADRHAGHRCASLDPPTPISCGTLARRQRPTSSFEHGSTLRRLNASGADWRSEPPPCA